MDECEGVPICAHFFFVPVAQQRLAEDYRANASPIHCDALDPIGRDRALNQSVLAQDLQSLRRLLGEQLLFAPRLAKVG